MNAFTRLEQLQQLRKRIDTEIRAEERKVAARKRAAAKIAKPRAARQYPDGTVEERAAQVGVTAAHVKAWALRAGLITEVKRGRLAATLLDAYLADNDAEREVP